MSTQSVRVRLSDEEVTGWVDGDYHDLARWVVADVLRDYLSVLVNTPTLIDNPSYLVTYNTAVNAAKFSIGNLIESVDGLDQYSYCEDVYRSWVNYLEWFNQSIDEFLNSTVDKMVSFLLNFCHEYLHLEDYIDTTHKPHRRVTIMVYRRYHLLVYHINF